MSSHTRPGCIRPPRPTCSTAALTVARSLPARGVETVFGSTGRPVRPPFDSSNQTNIRVIVPCREQRACPPSQAHARANSTTHVIIATDGRLRWGVCRAWSQMPKVPALNWLLQYRPRFGPQHHADAKHPRRWDGYGIVAEHQRPTSPVLSSARDDRPSETARQATRYRNKNRVSNNEALRLTGKE